MARQKGHEVLRVEAFSDAVFAFALTLLVVSLEVPRDFDQLIRSMKGFLPFAFTFALVTWIWWEHNHFFRRYGTEDGITITVNAVLMFIVLFYMYPLKAIWSAFIGGLVLGDEDQMRIPLSQLSTVFVIYGSGFVLIFSTFAVLYWHAHSRRVLLGLTTLEAFDARAAMRMHLLTVAVGLVSTLTALVAPTRWSWLAGPVYGLLAPVQFINGSRMSKARARLQSQARE